MDKGKLILSVALDDQHALLERLARAQPKQQRIIIESEGQR